MSKPYETIVNPQLGFAVCDLCSQPLNVVALLNDKGEQTTGFKFFCETCHITMDAIGDPKEGLYRITRTGN